MYRLVGWLVLRLMMALWSISKIICALVNFVYSFGVGFGTSSPIRATFLGENEINSDMVL